MKRVLPLVLALCAGIAVGFVIGSIGSETPPTPPADERGEGSRPGRPGASAAGRDLAVLRTDLERLRRENADLRSRLDAAGAGTNRSGGASGAFVVSPDGTEDPVRLEGESGDPETGDLRVRVTGPDGLPRAGVSVSATRYSAGREQLNRVSESDGTAVFEGLVPDRYTLSASFPRPTTAADGPTGNAYRSVYAQVLAGRVTRVSLPGPRGEALVTGRVTDAEGKTFKDAFVGLHGTDTFFSDSFTAKTDEAGRYRLESIPPGRYRVRAYGGAVPYSRNPHGEIVVRSGTVEYDLVVGAEGLTGTVRDAATGKPIAGVRIATSGSAYRNATTDVGGRYRLFDIGPGNYRLSVSKDGYAFKWVRDVKVKGPGESLDIELERGATLHITAVDSEGKPAVGHLHLGFVPLTEGGLRLGTSVTTDAEGRAVYRQAKPGEYEMRLSIEGIGSAQFNKTIQPGENTIDVRLE